MNKRRIVKQIVESVVNRLLLGEGEDKPATTIENAQALLDKGYDPKKVFGWVGGFNEGFAKVELYSKWNFINEEGKLLSKQWFDKSKDFDGDFAMVKLEGKGWNYLNKKGEILCNQWHQHVFPFREGLALVGFDYRYNFINMKGKYISDQWLEDSGFFKNGVVDVVIDNVKYKMDKNGNLSEPLGKNVYNIKAY